MQSCESANIVDCTVGVMQQYQPMLAAVLNSHSCIAWPSSQCIAHHQDRVPDRVPPMSQFRAGEPTMKCSTDSNYLLCATIVHHGK